MLNASYTILGTGALTQDWSDPNLISTNNDWSKVPSIIGYNGGATSLGANPSAVTATGPLADQVLANQGNNAALSNGGVAEFDALVINSVANNTVAFQGSGSAVAPNLVFFVDTTNVTSIHFKANIRDIDTAGDTAQPIGLQYRVVTSDTDTTTPYTNVVIPGADGKDSKGNLVYLTDVTDSGNTKVTAIDAVLPVGAENQAKVQIRILTINAGGSDEFLGIDDVNISGTSTVPGSLQFSAPTYSVVEGTPSATITVSRAGGSLGIVGATYTASNGSAVSPGDYAATTGTVTFADGDTAPKTFTIPIVDDSDAEPTETINIALSAPTGGATLGTQTTAVLNLVDNDNFGSFQFSSTSYTVDEAAGTVTIRVDRANGSVGAKSVSYATTNGTAVQPGDYTSTSGTLNFADGETFQTFTVPIIVDATHELTETFTLTLSNPTGGSNLGTPTTTTVSILDDDAPTGVLLNEIDVDPSGTDQPYGYIELRGTAGSDLSNVYFLSLEGDIETTPTGVGAADLAISLGAFSFGTNGLLVITSTTGGFTIPAATTVVTSTFLDAATTQSIEHNSNSFLVVYSPTTILRTTDLDLDDDGTIDNLPSGAVILDGIGWLDGSNPSDKAYGAILGPQYATDIPADAASRGNSSTPLSSGAWVFGELLATDGNKTVAYDPANSNGPSGYALTPGEANLPYSQNGVFQFSESDYTVTEGGAKVTITIERLGGAVGDVSVEYTTTAGTATAGSDYSSKSGSIFWPDSDSEPISFTIDILQDALVELTETFTVSLIATTGGAVIGSQATSSVSVVDDDSAGALQFSVADYTVNEAAGTATVTVTRIGGTVGAVSVHYATSDGSATAGDDYTSASGTLNFADGKASATFTIPILADTLNEAAETIVLTLSSATGGAVLGTPINANLIIADDDAPTVLLNEVNINPPTGTDQPFEYLEILGPGGGSLNGVYILSLEGDNNTGSSNRGTADLVFSIGSVSLGSNGLLVITSTSGGFTIPAATTVVTTSAFDTTSTQSLENGSSSFLVVYSPINPIVQGTDYDTTDSGTLALPVGAVILDAIGWKDTDDVANDMVYGGVELSQSSGTPDAATRFPTNDTPLTVSAWYNGDLSDGGKGNASVTYDTGKASANIPAAAILTPGSGNFGPAAATFAVSSFTATASGFTIQFNDAFDATVLNLYDTQTGGLGDPDIVIEGVNNGQIAGSLIVDAAGNSVTFVATGSILPADDYTVTLRSDVDGFVSTGGDVLDGDSDGTPGTNYVDSFTITESPFPKVVISIPDFARGSGQDVSLPPADFLGIPLTLSDATGVLSLDLNIDYDPALITFTGATVADGVPGSVTFNPNFATGRARLAYSGSTQAGSGETILLYLQATIPVDAPYTAKEVLDLNGDQLNEGLIQSIADDAVHVAAYFGDTSGNGDIGSFDAALIQRVATGLDGGYAAFQLADPVLVGDISGSGDIGAFDAALIKQYAVGFFVPQIPDLPLDGPTDFAGLDPKISLGRDLMVLPGGSIRVPVYLDQTDRVPINMSAIEALIGFDSSRFIVTGVSNGSISEGFALDWIVDAASGTLYITSASSMGGIRLNPGAHGEIAWIDLATRPDAAPGASPLNLLATGPVGRSTRSTRLDEGRLVLIPAPTNAPDDSVDGVITVASVSAPTPSVDTGAVDAVLANDRVDDFFASADGFGVYIAPPEATSILLPPVSSKRRAQRVALARSL